MVDVILISCLSFNQQKIAEPLGVCYLASVLRANGYKVEVIDPAIEGWSVDETVDVILKKPCCVLGLSMIRDANISNTYKIVSKLQSMDYKTKYFVGGHGPSIGVYNNSSLYLELGRIIDGFIIGEGENSFLELVDAIIKGGNWKNTRGIAYLDNNDIFHVNPIPDKIQDIDEIPFMARDVLACYVEKYGKKIQASMLSSRGCAYSSCTYCSVGSFEKLQKGKCSRYRSINNIIEEIKYVYNEFGITTFNFEDDNFFMYGEKGIARLNEFCSKVEELNFKINFTFYCRANLVTYDIFFRLKQVGLNGIFLGIESFSDAALKFYNKGLRMEDMLNALDILNHLGFSAEVGSEYRILVGFILWNPKVKIEDLKIASRYIKKYKMPPKLFTRKLMVYPGCKIESILKEEGLYTNENSFGWKYEYPQMKSVEELICKFINDIGSYRDQIRTIEKATLQFDTNVNINVEKLIEHRKYMDDICYRYMEGIVGYIDILDETNIHKENLDDFDNKMRQDFFNYIENAGVHDIVSKAWATINLDSKMVDVFRK